MAKLSDYQRQVLQMRPAYFMSPDGNRLRVWVNGRRTFGARGFLNRLFRRV